MARRLSRDDADRFHDYNLYVPTRTIYMGSEEGGEEESGVEAIMAARTIKNLKVLESLSSDPIDMILNSPGGDVMHGLAIYDAIKNCKCHVRIIVYGHAMSMGSVILQAADERIMSPMSSQMVHYGSLGISGEAKTVYKTVEENKRIDKWMEQMYINKIREKHPKFKISDLKRMLNHDTFLTAERSVELGLADKILGEENGT